MQSRDERSSVVEGTCHATLRDTDRDVNSRNDELPYGARRCAIAG